MEIDSNFISTYKCNKNLLQSSTKKISFGEEFGSTAVN